MFLSFLLIHLDIASADEDGIAALEGKPIKIVFPSGYEKLEWKSNEFTLSASLYVNNESGKVAKIICQFPGKGVPYDSKEIGDLLPAWQKPFLDAVCRAANKWEFQGFKRMDGGIPPKEIGHFLNFRFVRGTLNQCKVEIRNDNGVVADDAPGISPAPEGEQKPKEIPPLPFQK